MLRKTVLLITLVKHKQQDAEPQNKITSLCWHFFDLRVFVLYIFLIIL
jgi:hypothetical protein